MQPLFYRFGFDILLFGSALIFPWWVPVAIGGVGVFIFPVYWEIIAVALPLDILFSYSGAFFLNSQFVITYIALILFAVITIIREITR